MSRKASRKRAVTSTTSTGGSLSEINKGAKSPVIQFFLSQWEKILSVLGISAVAALGFWLAPLKEGLLHKIYKENADIVLLISTSEVSKGQAVEVKVRVKPTSQIDVADGTVKLIYSPNDFELGPGAMDSFNVKKSTSMRILDEGSFTLFAKSSKSRTESTLKAVYTTKYGTYESLPAIVIILPSQITDFSPYIEKTGSKEINLSGIWRIEIGGALGGMKIRQDARSDISGEYWLGNKTDGSAFPIEGYKDGTSFKVFYLKDAKGDVRWRIDSNFSVNSEDKRFIEIKGCAYSIVRDRSVRRDSAVSQTALCVNRDYVGWKGMGASTFYATAQMK